MVNLINKCQLEGCFNLTKKHHSRGYNKYCSEECVSKSVSIRMKANPPIWSKGVKASAETRAKMSASRMGNDYHKGKLASPELKAKLSAMRKGRKGHTPSEESKQKISDSLKKLYANGYVHPNKGTTISNAQKLHLSKCAAEQYKKNDMSKCRTSYPRGLFCQSSSEEMFIEQSYEFLKEKLNSETEKGGYIKTPYGFYVPDFFVISNFHGECYVEIKSSWTYKKLFDRNKKQLDKINWINENTDKQIVVLIYDKDNRRRNYEYLKSVETE